MSISANAAAYLTEGSKKINEEKNKRKKRIEKERNRLEAEKQFKKTIKKIDKGIFKRIDEGKDCYSIVIENDCLIDLVKDYYHELGYCIVHYFDCYRRIIISWDKYLIGYKE